MGVPNKFDRLGAITINKLPAGYLAAEFLDYNPVSGYGGSCGVDVEVDFDSNTDIEVEVFSYKIGVNDGFFGAFNYNSQSQTVYCKFENSAELGFTYGNDKKTVIFEPYLHKKIRIRKNKTDNYIDGVLVNSNPAATFPAAKGWLWCWAIDTIKLPYHTPCSRLYSAKISNNGVAQRKMVAALDPAGKICMYDFVSKKAFYVYRDAVNGVAVGMTCKQALKLAELPAGGGSLTVSLPWEAQLVQHNAEVEAALQAAKSNGWMITVQYRDPEADSAVYNKYAECVTIADIKAVNADYKNDLNADGEWLYSTPKMYDLEYWFNKATKLKRFKGYLPASRGGFYTFSGSAMTYFECDMPSMTDGGFFLGNCPLADYFGQLPNMITAVMMFNGCVLNKASVIRVSSYLKSFTSGNHPITLGIHVDHKTDEEVAAAIADAEAKGWTVSVQWNGKATAQAASTFGLRRKPVYAKVGSMVLPDGTAEQYLSWGHYVTNWEANGYQEFSSIEEAEEYFNINQTEEV